MTIHTREYTHERTGWPPPADPEPFVADAQGWWTVGTMLADCLCARLETTAAGPPCVCLMIPGDQVIADYCCECDAGVGQAWVRLNRVFMTRNFPQPITTQPCPDGFWACEFEVGVLRCASTVDEEGNPPLPHALSWDAAMVYDDAAAVADTGQCCLPAGLPRLVGDWKPMQGGACTGGATVITVQMVPGPLSVAQQETAEQRQAREHCAHVEGSRR